MNDVIYKDSKHPPNILHVMFLNGYHLCDKLLQRTKMAIETNKQTNPCVLSNIMWAQINKLIHENLWWFYCSWTNALVFCKPSKVNIQLVRTLGDWHMMEGYTYHKYIENPNIPKFFPNSFIINLWFNIFLIKYSYMDSQHHL